MSELDDLSTVDRVDDNAVLQYLRTQPDFFKRHPGAFTELNVTHDSGAAVSLVERQMLSLREGNRRMRAQVDDMIAAAHHNQSLSEGVHVLARALLAARGVDALVEAAHGALLRSASADQVAIVLFSESDCGTVAGSPLRRVTSGDTGWQAFSSMLDERLIRCGLATDAQLAFLFGERAASVGSTAIAPLHAERNLGVLAMASRDDTVFTRDKGHLFLEQVAGLISAGIAREIA